MFNKLAVLIVTMFICSCTTVPDATYKELTVGGKKVKYVSQECHPSVKWDGFEVAIEDLEFPLASQNPLTFSIGKIGYEEKSIREIRNTIFYFDGLLTATCQTLVRLTKESSILSYSLHRDKILENLANYLSELEGVDNEEELKEINTSVKLKMKNEDEKFKKNILK